MIWLAVAVPAVLALPFAHRWFRRRQNAKRLAITTPNGVCTGQFVRIGGIEQWISVRGDDRANPVLLVVHGGPGCPYEMFATITRPWEAHFTIVQWDQRGAGRTFGRTGKVPLSMADLVRDGIEVAEWVRERFGRPILLGSSFGSAIALHLAHDRPDLFAAYVGTDQNVRMAGDLDPVLARLRAQGRHRLARRLQRLPAEWTAKDWTTVSKAILATAPGPDPIRTLIGPAMWFSPTMSLRDLGNLWRGMEFSNERLCGEYPRIDARSIGTRYDIGVYIFQGEDDVLTEPAAAAEFLAGIEAPVKELRLISGAGHFAAFTQPARFLDLLLLSTRRMMGNV